MNRQQSLPALLLLSCLDKVKEIKKKVSAAADGNNILRCLPPLWFVFLSFTFTLTHPSFFPLLSTPLRSSPQHTRAGSWFSEPSSEKSSPSHTHTHTQSCTCVTQTVNFYQPPAHLAPLLNSVFFPLLSLISLNFHSCLLKRSLLCLVFCSHGVIRTFLPPEP